MRVDAVSWNGCALALPNGSVLTAAVVLGLLLHGEAAAEEVSDLSLDVTYLATPTDWCPADAGVPMRVAMVGPDIIRGPGELPRKVVERRGGRLDITHSAENTASFNRPDTFEGPNAEVIGRFSAEFQACLSALDAGRATGTWRLTGPDGLELETGALENEGLAFSIAVPFFRPVGGPLTAYYAQFGERLLFTAGKPESKTKQTFLAEPAKE